MSTAPASTSYIIASGDEGLQLNSGRRLGFVGSGYGLEFFPQALKVLRADLSSNLVLTSTQEDDWLAVQLKSKNPNLYQETLTKFAADHDLPYIGQFDYGDPRELDDHLTKGHLVRPQKIHVADQICFTIGGGEDTYNLRQLVISADYLHGLTPKQAAAIITTQVQFYRQLLARSLKFSVATAGSLADNFKNRNKTALDQILSTLT
jgi:hypothetical protein